jgi:hypothetical protein
MATIDLPDRGYVNRNIRPVNPGGVAEGSLGGPSEYIDRPGYRYAVQFDLPAIPSAKEARIFENLLEQASGGVLPRPDVSYPWPLDVKAIPAGTPLVNGSSPPGAVIPLKGLTPGCVIRVGQPLAVIIADGTGFIHKATAEAIADGAGHATVAVLPLTRATFPDNATVEIEHPRLRGTLSWDGSTQGSSGTRPFSFSITERR